MRVTGNGGSTTGGAGSNQKIRRLIRPQSVAEQVVSGLIVAGVIAGIGLLLIWFSADGSAPDRVTVECIAPPAIRVDQLVTLTYAINAEAAVDVGLGAGLYDEAGVDHSTGIGDQDSLRLQTGRNRATRPFKVPSDSPAGRYELVAEIWPANKIGADGVETLADSPCAFVTIR